jgi:hypothetical protein
MMFGLPGLAEVSAGQDGVDPENVRPISPSKPS